MLRRDAPSAGREVGGGRRRVPVACRGGRRFGSSAGASAVSHAMAVRASGRPAGRGRDAACSGARESQTATAQAGGSPLRRPSSRRPRGASARLPGPRHGALSARRRSGRYRRQRGRRDEQPRDKDVPRHWHPTARVACGSTEPSYRHRNAWMTARAGPPARPGGARECPCRLRGRSGGRRRLIATEDRLVSYG